MPIDKSKIANFNEIWAEFDSKEKGFIKKKKFHEFIMAFMNENYNSQLASRPYIDDDEGYDPDIEEDPDHPRPIKFIGVKEFHERTTDFLFSSFDINNEGIITKPQALNCIKGLSGYLQGFELKVFFRVLDVNRDQKISREEMCKMKYYLGLPYSESTMLKNFDNKLGKQFKSVNYKKFFYLFKDKTTEEETAYDPKLFTIKPPEEDKKKDDKKDDKKKDKKKKDDDSGEGTEGNCCLLI